MKLLSDDWTTDGKKVDEAAEALLNRLMIHVNGALIEFLRQRRLKREIETLAPEAKMRLLYDAVDGYIAFAGPHAVCSHAPLKSESGGCRLSACCKLPPDVFASERRVLDELPSSAYRDPYYCRFFDSQKRICTVYERRPVMCRLFFNFENDSRYCGDACSKARSLKTAVFMFFEPFLGFYTGAYRT